MLKTWLSALLAIGSRNVRAHSFSRKRPTTANASSLLSIALLLCTACFWGCAGNDDSSDSDKSCSIDPASLDFSSFDQAMNTYIADKKMAGASAAIVDKCLGIVHEKGYGSFDANRIYLIASSSKVLSVGILMRLVDQGLLDIDAPISNYRNRSRGCW